MLVFRVGNIIIVCVVHVIWFTNTPNMILAAVEAMAPLSGGACGRRGDGLPNVGWSWTYVDSVDVVGLW